MTVDLERPLISFISSIEQVEGESRYREVRKQKGVGKKGRHEGLRL